MADTFHNFIGGAFHAPEGGDIFTRTNPADERDVIGAFPDSDAGEVERAVAAAKGALPAWRKLSPDARSQFLFRAADILERRKAEVAAALTREEGKSIAESTGETGRGVVLLRYYAGEGLRLGGDVIPSVNPNVLFFTER
ncbi:MAG: aldehyde dehydrogenase family protein, partial [Fibrella sp.]|nr:aldehyde dehydrogenase family protein [Armatimonadota bacterium]